MIPQISIGNVDLAVERTKEVGRLPRYVMDNGLFERRRIETQQAVHDLMANSRGSLLPDTLRLKGISSRRNAIPEALFSVEPSRMLDGDVEQLPIAWTFSYEGDNVEYGKKVVRLLISNVKTLFGGGAGRIACLEAWEVFQPDDLANYGCDVEDLVWTDLSGDENYVYKAHSLTGDEYYDYKTHSVEGKRGNTCDVPLHFDSGGPEVVSPSDKEGAYKILKCMERTTNKVVRMPPDFPVIDMAGPGRRMIQVTGGRDHGEQSAGGMLDILICFGLLSTASGKLIATEGNDDVDVWWAVPPMGFRAWMEKAVTKYPVSLERTHEGLAVDR